jgi:hypothetical protein
MLKGRLGWSAGAGVCCARKVEPQVPIGSSRQARSTRVPAKGVESHPQGDVARAEVVFRGDPTRRDRLRPSDRIDVHFARCGYSGLLVER